MSAGFIQNRPFGLIDGQGAVIQDTYDDESFRGKYTGGNLVLKGFARPGSDEGENVWQIAQLEYDGDNNVISIKWPIDPNGRASNDYQFSWTTADGGGYTYA